MTRQVQVLGTGCTACRRLASMVEEAATHHGVDLQLEKVGDITRILAHDVASTPALVVDGEVKCVGRVPSMNELLAMLRQ